MMPTISEGDLIIYKPYKDKEDLLFEGSLVVVKYPINKKKLIIKRIAKIDSSKIMLLGDNQSKSTDSRQFGEINKSQIQGVVETIISKNK